MSGAVAEWLIQHRSTLLPRWVSMASERIISNGNGHDNGHDHDHDTEVASTEPLQTDPPDSLIAAHACTIEETLAHLYDGLILAARGDMSALDEHIQTVSGVSNGLYTQLPDILYVPFSFRRLAYDVLRTDGVHDSSALNMLDILDELVLLTEHLAEQFTHAVVSHAEKDIQERIERAEFITQSMALAMEEADQTTLQLSLLNQMTQRLQASLDSADIAQLVESIGTNLIEFLDVAHVSIWLPDKPLTSITIEDMPHRVLLVGHCWEREPAPDMERCNDIIDITVDDHSADATDLILRAYDKSQILYDIAPDPSTQGAWYQAGYGVLAIPMIVKDRCTGVVVLQDPNPIERLSRMQQDLAVAVVNQASTSLENARLYTEVRRFNSELEQLVTQRTSEVKIEKDRLSTLHEIATEISSTLDLDNLLETSLNLLARITQVEYGSIMLMSYESDLLVSRAFLGGHRVNAFASLPVGRGIAGWVAQHKKPVIIPDIQQDERWATSPVSEGGIVQERGSMIAVPLVAHNEMLGVLTLSHEKVGYFNDDHLRLLTASAGAISIGIHNANMYNAIVQEMERSSELLAQQRAEASKTQAILQSLSDGVLVCETNGDVILSNPAASRILQWDLAELFLTDLPTLLQRILGTHVDSLPLKELLEHPLDINRESRTFETVARVGMRDVQFTLGPVMKEYDELLGALLTVRDVTREREYDRLRSEFISTMSHELRTPMTAIKGFTQLLGMGSLGAINDTQREFLNTIQSNAERMISIINDVLDITKIETGSIEVEMRPLHLAEVLSGVMTELQPLIRDRQHELTISIAQGLPLVRGDTGRLHQVLYNLLSNAIKYTPCGGKVWVEAHEANIESLPEHIRVMTRVSRRYVQLDIRDTGVGIAEDELQRVFERFYRTENPLKVEAGGTGLGLSLVKPLIELFGGHIWAESTLGEGSTFSFILPAV